MATLSGPRLPARSGTTKQVVVFLHGYGADGNDLIALGQQWQVWLPDCAFVSPHAPEPCAAGGGGRQWFGLTFRDPDERWRGVNHAAPALDAFLDAELASRKIAPEKLALVGFSQGTMMALHVGLRRKVGAILGFSGQLVGPEHLPKPERPPPVLLVHGDRDEVIPLDALFDSAEALAKADIPTQWHLSLGVGHGIDGGALKHGGLFLAQSFGLKTPG